MRKLRGLTEQKGSCQFTKRLSKISNPHLAQARSVTGGFCECCSVLATRPGQMLQIVKQGSCGLFFSAQ
jgi:hypothetical protein